MLLVSEGWDSADRRGRRHRAPARRAEPKSAGRRNPEESRRTDCGPDAAATILLNLFSNACKFTKQGQVTLRARRVLADGRDWIDLTVADTGIGITADQQGKL